MKKILYLALFSFLIQSSIYAEGSTAKTKIKTLIIENKLDDAKALADEEIKNNPSDIDIIRRRGFVHFMQGNYRSATEDFTSYLALKPKSAKAYLYRGLAYLAMGNDKKGKEDVKKALSINPNLMATVNELKPKIESKQSNGFVTTKKGVPVKTKKGSVGYKTKR